MKNWIVYYLHKSPIFPHKLSKEFSSKKQTLSTLEAFSSLSKFSHYLFTFTTHRKYSQTSFVYFLTFSNCAFKWGTENTVFVYLWLKFVLSCVRLHWTGTKMGISRNYRIFYAYFCSQKWFKNGNKSMLNFSDLFKKNWIFESLIKNLFQHFCFQHIHRF